MQLVKNETHGNTLQVFNCELGQVRVIVENGEPLFLASDIAQALGYEKKSKMYERLDDDDKVVKSPRIHGSSILELPQNVTKVMFITESGLYDSILGSNKPQAKQFKKWITRDVLPSIRKTGSYQVKPLLDTSDPIAVLEALKDSVEKQIVLLKENKVLKIENAEKQGRLDDYKAIERTRRSKGELSASINRNIRKIAQERFNSNYKLAYQYVYGLFAKRRLINDKINMEYLKKNNDYLAEVLEITLSEID